MFPAPTLFLSMPGLMLTSASYPASNPKPSTLSLLSPKPDCPTPASSFVIFAKDECDDSDSVGKERIVEEGEGARVSGGENTPTPAKAWLPSPAAVKYEKPDSPLRGRVVDGGANDWARPPTEFVTDTVSFSSPSAKNGTSAGCLSVGVRRVRAIIYAIIS